MTATRQRKKAPEDDVSTASDESARRRSTENGSDSDFECGSPSKSKRPSARSRFTRSLSSVSLSSPSKDLDADKRVMSPMQERFNAITMIPTMVYTLHFVLAGRWVPGGDELMGKEGLSFDDDPACLDSRVFPHLPAIPPLPVVATVLGICSHAPVSFLYHWFYATKIVPSKRIQHWSRRLDHAFIHFASACASYATSGNVYYFFVNALYNLEGAYRQFEEEVIPKRNLSRVGTSIILYLLPILEYGEYRLFAKFMVMFAICGWLFVKYPVEGWSHGVFHLVLTALPVFIFEAALQLESSQAQISLAAKCATMAVQT